VSQSGRAFYVHIGQLNPFSFAVSTIPSIYCAELAPLVLKKPGFPALTKGFYGAFNTFVADLQAAILQESNQLKPLFSIFYNNRNLSLFIIQLFIDVG